VGRRGDEIADIMVNGSGTVYIEVGGKIQKTGIRFRDNQQLLNICQRIVAASSRESPRRGTGRISERGLRRMSIATSRRMPRGAQGPPPIVCHSKPCGQCCGPVAKCQVRSAYSGHEN
jgi:hypothetical protein